MYINKWRRENKAFDLINLDIEAHKGLGIVKMNAQFCKTKILKLLSDETYFKPIPGSKLQVYLFNKIKNLTTEKKRKTNKDINFPLKFECKTSTFYGLPKIRESYIIKNSCSDDKVCEYCNSRSYRLYA